ncbi:MAG TPA: type I 3-dehydroquinate dehydratase [Tepidisphaeraceae bacterium]|jgi:3-dehydroquinate dehydratase/shikimate dehydrogenase
MNRSSTTRLCVPILVRDHDQAVADAARAAEAGADMVELRIDRMTDAAAVARLVKAVRLPVIATCRAAAEGGESTLGDAERLTLLLAAGEAGASYLDIEWAAVQANQWAGPQQPRDRRPGWIYSAHDFETRPTKLTQLVADLADAPCDVAKVVWRARSVRDNLEAFEILLGRTKPSIALCMGDAGAISRLLAPKFGAFLTFATLDAASGTAPGQPTVESLKQTFRWDAQRADTKVYGVVGSPVGHSMSPAIHNASFEAIGFDGVYVPLLVEPSYESFKAFMETFVPFDALHLSGLSITIPHKENALRYLTEKGATIDPLATRIGAINTIVIDRADGNALCGFSSDHAAILDSITAALGIDRAALAGYRVAVLGAGGTGRTAVAALAECGATVVVYNRTFERAAALADEFSGHSGKVVAAKFDKLCDSCCQIFINTTSVGMTPNVDASPIDGTGLEFNASHLVFDTIYTPQDTKLLTAARAAGAKTIGGAEMFVRQAAAQFEAFTGIAAPTASMRQVLNERLGLSRPQMNADKRG